MKKTRQKGMGEKTDRLSAAIQKLRPRCFVLPMRYHAISRNRKPRRWLYSQ